MIYNVKAVYDLMDFQIHNGNAYGAVALDDSSEALTVGNGASRAIFIKTGAKIAFMDYAFLTDSAVSAKLYKDVLMPYVYSAAITVGAGASANGSVDISINGGDPLEVAVTAEDSAATVATAISAAIDALDDYSASASDNVVSVTYAAENYAPMIVDIDTGETGVEASAEVTAAATNLTEATAHNRNHVSNRTAASSVYVAADTVTFSSCTTEDSAVAESMLLNKENLDAKRILASNAIYAVLLSNAGETSATILPQFLWHEM